MAIKIYNTLSRQKEDFVPLVPGQVKMYVCGPTVYNYIHIGNARSTVAFDTIRKYLIYKGFDVTYVSNFTDVDDKIIDRARTEGLAAKEISNRYIAAYQQDTASLGVTPADHHPQVVNYIQEIQDFIQELIKKDMAYEVAGDVYFRVNRFPNYGKLAGKNLAELEVGASGRLDDKQSLKADPMDFALWKAVADDSLSFDSPWGSGRPGWHIECSVMSTSLLGETLDIHGGGQDLEFPHHTNEIAQSEAKTGKPFVNYWMHNGFVTVKDGEKMSKSLGNFQTVHDLLESVDAQVLRLFLVGTHYRKPLSFTEDNLSLAKNNLDKIKHGYETLQFNLANKPHTRSASNQLAQFRVDFEAAMDDDFNIQNGLDVLYDLIKAVHKGLNHPEVLAFFEQLLKIIGLDFSGQSLDDRIETLIKQRQEARRDKNFALADQIRDALAKEGIQLLDTAEGVRWHRE